MECCITDNPWLAHPVISDVAVYFLIPLLRVSFVFDIHIIFLELFAAVFIKQEECRTRIFKNRVLRRMFGPKRDEVTGEYRR
jgi:hypothetical protein